MSNARELAELGGSYGQGGFTGFKNRIINGAMMIDQRNAGASVNPTNGQFLVDRWAVAVSQDSKLTAQQNAGAVTPPSGFSNYLGFTSSSAYSVLTGDYFLFQQGIEGHNVSDLDYGTASAQSVTLSFWVRSSLTGTFGGSLWNSANTRAYPFSYTISNANTWEQKSVTIAGDTSQATGTGNSAGLYLRMDLGSGSTYGSGTAGAWTSSNVVCPTGSTSVVSTSGATFYITGVQLEKGSTATSFDVRPYGSELALCQRYYWYLGGETAYQNVVIGTWYTTTDCVGIVQYPIQMRANPTISKSGNWGNLGGTGTIGSSLNTDQITSKNVQLGASGGSGGTGSQASVIRANNDTAFRLTFNAEL